MNQIYEFSFDRSQLTKVVAGTLSLVGLVFCTGLLVGVAFQVYTPAPTLVATTTAPSQPEPVAAPVIEQEAAVEPPDAGQDAVQNDGQKFSDADLMDPDVSASVPAALKSAAKPARKTVVPVEPHPVKRVKPVDRDMFAVQLGAFLNSENAGVLVHRLEAKGFDSEVIALEDSHGRMWYVVRYGAFLNRAEAVAAASELRTRQGFDGVVRPADAL